MKPLEVFSISTDNSMETDRYIIIARNAWKALELFKREKPTRLWKEMCVKRYQYGDVLLTDSRDWTEAHDVKELISKAESFETPMLFGYHKGMRLYLVDDKFGIVALTMKDMLKLLMTLISGEYFMELAWAMHESDDFEPGTGVYDPNPIVMIPGDSIITITKTWGCITATVANHVEWEASEGIAAAHLLFVRGYALHTKFALAPPNSLSQKGFLVFQ